MLDRKINFTSKWTLCATVTYADIGSLKSLHTYIKKCLYHMPVKFEQKSHALKLHEIVSFLTKQKRVFIAIFDTKSWRLFWKTFLKFVFNTKLLI